MSNIIEWQLGGSQTAFPLRNIDLEKLSYTSPDIANSLFSILIDASIIMDSESTFVSLLTVYSVDGHINIKVKFESGITAFGVDVDGVCHLTDNYGYGRGVIVVNNTHQQVPLLLGAITFSKNEVKFDQCALIIIPNNVLESIKIDDNKLSGRVRLVEGDGIRMVSKGNNTIRIDAIGSPNEVDLSNCLPSNRGPALQYLRIIPPTYTPPINPELDTSTLKPDLAGNVNILSGAYTVPKTLTSKSQLLRINPSGNGLELSLII